MGRRAGVAEILTNIGCHGFRATGITEHLKKNGSKLEVAADGCHGQAQFSGCFLYWPPPLRTRNAFTQARR